MRIIIILAMMLGVTASAATLEGRDFPEKRTIGKKSMVLNGVAVRTKDRMGMPLKVYVASLYVPEKTKDAEKLIAPGDRFLEMTFLRALPGKMLQEAFKDHFAKNCRAKCETEQASFQKFSEYLVNMKKDSRIGLSFSKNGVDIEVVGAKENKKGRIEGAAFAENLMAVFIGKAPPTEEVKSGLLGMTVPPAKNN